MCERWKSFENFLADMGESPIGMSIDRFPNKDGNYEPGNCRWATAKEQARNTSVTRSVTANGETLPLTEWAERLGLDGRVIHLRLKRGWSEQEAIDGTGCKLLRGEQNKSSRITADCAKEIRAMVGKSTRKIAKQFGISQTQVRNIIKGKHWSIITLAESPK